MRVHSHLTTTMWFCHFFLSSGVNSNICNHTSHFKSWVDDTKSLSRCRQVRTGPDSSQNNAWWTPQYKDQTNTYKDQTNTYSIANRFVTAKERQPLQSELVHDVVLNFNIAFFKDVIFLWNHWYTCCLLLVKSALGLITKVDLHVCAIYFSVSSSSIGTSLLNNSVLHT